MDAESYVDLTSHGEVRALWTHGADPYGALIHTTIDVWAVQQTEWVPHHIDLLIKVPAHRTLLIKTGDIRFPLGMGDLLTRMESDARAEAQASPVAVLRRTSNLEVRRRCFGRVYRN